MRQLVALAIVLALVCPLATAQESANALYNEGIVHLQEGRLDEAIASFTRAVRISKDFEDAYIARGLAWRQKGKLEEAVADYTQAIAINPRQPLAYYNRGAVYEFAGDYRKAIEDYGRVLKYATAEDRTDAFKARGRALSISGQFHAAMRDFKAAQSLSPNDAEVYVLRGDAYRRGGDATKALADYDRALKLDPRSASACNGRGLIFLEKKKFDLAIPQFQKACDLEPHYSFYYNLGVACDKAGRKEAAVKAYVNFIRKAPENHPGLPKASRRLQELQSAPGED